MSPQAGFSDTYIASARTTSQLVTDLGNWSPKIQRLAADELAKRTSETTALLPTLNALANDPNGTSRVGACLALGKIANSNSAPVLAALLTDPQNHVRYAAAEGMRYLSQTAKMGQLNTILAAAASTATPLLPFNEEDPLHFAHARLAMLLFYSGNAYGPKGVIYGTGINGVSPRRPLSGDPGRGGQPDRAGPQHADRNLQEPHRRGRQRLGRYPCRFDPLPRPGRQDVRRWHPAGRHRGAASQGHRRGGPAQHGFHGQTTRATTPIRLLSECSRNTRAPPPPCVPDPDVVGFCQALLGGSQAAAAQAVLDAIAADTNPVTLTPFKSIQSVTANATALTLPANQTVLHVSATDLAKGDLDLHLAQGPWCGPCHFHS